MIAKVTPFLPLHSFDYATGIDERRLNAERFFPWAVDKDVRLFY
jgi:hypothetical protein